MGSEFWIRFNVVTRLTIGFLDWNFLSFFFSSLYVLFLFKMLFHLVSQANRFHVARLRLTRKILIAIRYGTEKCIFFYLFFTSRCECRSSCQLTLHQRFVIRLHYLLRRLHLLVQRLVHQRQQLGLESDLVVGRHRLEAVVSILAWISLQKRNRTNYFRSIRYHRINRNWEISREMEGRHFSIYISILYIFLKIREKRN